MIFAIDFDGTIVTHKYPYVGTLVPFAKEVINTLASNGHKCFLYTMRSDSTLEDAKNFCINNDIKLCDWNRSPAQFSNSPKQYADLYIDDSAIGCHLTVDEQYNVYVDWIKVAEHLKVVGAITNKQFDDLKQ